MSENDDKVGYGRPPRHSQFKPGQSGNPKGRPKGSRNFATLAAKVLDSKIMSRENGQPREMTRCEAILLTQANKAIIKGDTGAARFCLSLEYPELMQDEDGSSLTGEDQAVIRAYEERIRREAMGNNKAATGQTSGPAEDANGTVGHNNSLNKGDDNPVVP